jgi:hypothetical protein
MSSRILRFAGGQSVICYAGINSKTNRQILGQMRVLFLFLVAFMASCIPARAETERVSFGVRLFGLPVGVMATAINTEANGYAAASQFRTTGVVGLIARVRFEMESRGRGVHPDFDPAYYREDMDTGFRTSSNDLSFASGDERVDPLAAILSILSDREAGRGCAVSGQTWDGKRSMSFELVENRRGDAGVTCTGVAVRLSGYTADEMAEATRFPFTVDYDLSGAWLRVQRAVVETIHGKVALVRR